MILDQQQTEEFDFVNLGTTTNPKVGQTFQPSITNPLARFEVSLAKAGSPTDNIKLEIYADNAGVPGALLATADNQIVGSTLLVGFGNPTICDFDFAVGPTLVANTTYWAVLSRTGANDSTSFYKAFTSDDAVDQYTRGAAFFFNGTTWAPLSGGGFFYDFVFNEYYNLPFPPEVVGTVPSYSFRFKDQVTSY